MPGYKNILCCLDFSRRSEAALEAALDLARLYKAGLTLINVVEPGTSLLPGDPPLHRKKIPEREEIVRLRNYMEERYLPRAAGLDCHITLRRGEPSFEILAHLEEKPIDLVVVGSEGLKGVGLMLLGSVAETVSRKAPCSCLVVR